jgi:eukaryotic-like serine/threonine-protein kinase
MQNLIGQSIGRYHVIEQLGRGGMANVYKAYDTHLERYVAIKFIRREAIAAEISEKLLARFEREAKALARLIHPNIVGIIDYGEYQGSPHLVMPFLSGGTLKQYTGNPMPFKQAAHLLAPIARALDFAHRQGIIHRDVKPSNILITQDGEPMLSDFGIAKLLEGEEGLTLTGVGTSVGTPEYMAPEQWLGKPEPRSDVYSLGVVFFELVTGKKPYTADTPAAVMLKHINDELPRPKSIVPDLPESVEQIIFKAIDKKPENRYTSMADFVVALEKLVSYENIFYEMNDVSVVANEIIKSKNEEPMVERKKRKNDSTLDTDLPDSQPLDLRKRKGIPVWVYYLCGGILLVLLSIGIWKVKFITALLPTQRFVQTPIQRFTNISSVTKISVTPTKSFGIGSFEIANKDGMKLMFVPAGEFQMGTNFGNDDEEPLHTVYLDAFWIDQTDITNSLYQKCIDAGVCQSTSTGPRGCGATGFYGPKQPVVCVDRDMAKTYCEWTGRRLPTEAEWEKAARGIDGRIYPWGNIPPNSDLLNSDGNIGQTMDVGSYPSGASPYGVLDMAGNVWNWVSDWYSPNYYQDSLKGNPQGPTVGEDGVFRGGSWGEGQNEVLTYHRRSYSPDLMDLNTGFRCDVSATDLTKAPTPLSRLSNSLWITDTPTPTPLTRLSNNLWVTDTPLIPKQPTPTLVSISTNNPNGTLLYNDNFEDGYAQGFNFYSGQWIVVDDGTGNKVLQENPANGSSSILWP